MNPILPQVTGGGGGVGVGTGNGSFTSRPTVKPLKQYTESRREGGGNIFKIKENEKEKR
jgi:hypothetical protein